ncbi:hypothetical protein Tco_1196492 [Tanacetum coccineum]
MLPFRCFVDINTKSTSYAGAAGASAKDQPKVNSNFRPLVVDLVFNGVNISIPHKVVKKKWSIDTRLLKEELTRIPICVKLHNVPIQVFEEDEADLVDAVTIGIPSLTGDGFTKETIRVDPPIVTTSNVVTLAVEKTNDGFQIVSKKRRGKTTGIYSKKYNIPTSNSYSVLNDEEETEEEDVENVYDEAANLFTKRVEIHLSWLLCLRTEEEVGSGESGVQLKAWWGIVRVICEVFVDLKLAIRQDLGFIPSGNVVLSSTYVGKILGADQLLVILCYRYQESGIGYWILSMTISGSGVTFLPSEHNEVRQSG